MDCSICICPIDATTGSTQTRCGHSFHFGCLATWASKHDNCPLCRAPFTETDSIQRLEPEAPRLDPSVREYVQSYLQRPLRYSNWQRVIRMFGDGARAVADFVDLSTPNGQRLLRQRYEETIATHPPDHAETPAVAFVATYGCIPFATARAYLACHNQDPIETIMCLIQDANDLPIPRFKERDRGARDESYTSRDIQHRVGMTALTSQPVRDYDGYESV